jgi:hypothetical protein
MNEPVFKGPLRPLSLPDVLRHLRDSERTGALVLTRGNEQCILYLEGPSLVDAVSSDPDLLLHHRLMAEGVLSGAAYDRLRERLAEEAREGPALVELGILDPAALWQRTAAQVLEAATAPFGWERGEYLLLEGHRAAPGRFRQAIRTVDLAAEGLRRVRDRELFRDCVPAGDLVVESTPPAPEEDPPDRARLLPHEEYVRDLLDGRRTAAEVAAMSETGEFETYRALHLLMATGHARMVLAAAGSADPAGGRGLRGALETYNEMFACLHQHLLKEVGPIAAPILDKCLREVRGMNPDLLGGVTLRPDGGLTGMAIERNLRRMPAERRERALVEGLNELLYAVLLSVKRTLGRHHEAEAVRLLRGLRPAGSSLGA